MYDDSTGASLFGFLKSKKESPTAIKEIIMKFERAHSCKVKKLLVKRLRTHNAKELFFSNMKNGWLRKESCSNFLHRILRSPMEKPKD